MHMYPHSPSVLQSECIHFISSDTFRVYHRRFTQVAMKNKSITFVSDFHLSIEREFWWGQKLKNSKKLIRDIFLLLLISPSRNPGQYLRYTIYEVSTLGSCVATCAWFVVSPLMITQFSLRIGHVLSFLSESSRMSSFVSTLNIWPWTLNRMFPDICFFSANKSEQLTVVKLLDEFERTSVSLMILLRDGSFQLVARTWIDQFSFFDIRTARVTSVVDFWVIFQLEVCVFRAVTLVLPLVTSRKSNKKYRCPTTSRCHGSHLSWNIAEFNVNSRD